jgi:hypothetical protein
MASYDNSNEFDGRVINFADGTSLDVVDGEDIFKELATTMSKEDLIALRHIVSLIEETSATCIKDGKGALIPFIGEISIDARSLSQKKAAKTDAEMKALGLNSAIVRAKTISNFKNSSHTAFMKVDIARKMRTFYRLGLKVCTVWWDGAQYDGNEYESRNPEATIV